MSITITEALAEIKTIGKRIEKKREHILNYLVRQDAIKDQLEKDGGSPAVVARERQAIHDLGLRIVALRRGIQRANEKTDVTINGTTKTVADWLTWRRDVAPMERELLTRIRASILGARNDAKSKGLAVVPAGSEATQPLDLIINVDEADLAKQIETMEETLGTLDGQLSLKNATVTIEE